jgi:lysophospholipid acyltransferase (LPLAT)-like uncharacterized protein
MKKVFKALKSWLPANLLPLLISLVIRAVYATMRVETIGGENADAFHRRGEGLIHALWHGRMILGPFAYRGEEAHILISVHGDGELIARTMRIFGYQPVRGSSTKRGREALREMLRLTQRNCDLIITPDGPRGPAYVVKPGVAQLARLSGRAVVPFAFSASRGKLFASWDRFLIPYPFSKGVFVYGEPLRYEPGEDMEAFRLRIEQAMLDNLARADGYFRR